MSAEVKPGAVLHVVTATCGSYSDRSTWAVCAYLDRISAERHTAIANAWEMERSTRFRESYDYEEREKVNPHDPLSGGQWDDIKYEVSILAVVASPESFPSEVGPLTDYARGRGWIP